MIGTFYQHRSRLFLLLFLIACATQGCASGPRTLPGSAGGTRSIENKGSDTMVNLALAWAEAYMQLHPEVRISVTGGGSGTGIAAMINGTVDIANASREVTKEELNAARANGFSPTELMVARDAIAIVVHPSNPIDRITLQQLSDIYTGKLTNWKQVGGQDRPIVLLSRESNSGTYVYFLENVIRLGNSKSTELFSPETLLMPSSEGISTEIRQNPNAIGYDGLGYATPDQKIVAVARDASGPYVKPSAETVNSGAYPISRPLYMYMPRTPDGQVKAYLDWILKDGQVLVSVAAGLLLLRGRDAENPDQRVASSALPRPAWGPLVVGMLAVDLLWFGMPLTPTISADLYRLPNPAALRAREEMGAGRLYVDPAFDYDTLFKRYFSFDTFRSPDQAYWRPLRESLLPDLNAVDGIPALNNNEPLVIGRWQDLMSRLAAADWPVQRRLLAPMGVGYLLAESAPPGASPVVGVPHLYRLPDMPRSPGGLPRAWVVAQAHSITAPGAALSELMAPTFDPTTQVLLEMSRPPAPPASSPGDGIASRVISLREGWNRRTIDLVVAQPGYLVLAYMYYPGWTATVDGRPAEILRADYVLLAVPVEAGQHQVELYYRPLSFILGTAISGLAVLAMVGLALKERRKWLIGEADREW